MPDEGALLEGRSIGDNALHPREAMSVTKILKITEICKTLIKMISHGSGRRASVHHAGQPLAERLCRDLQRKAARQMSEREWLRDAREARVLVERWRSFCNPQRPHSALGYRTPAKTPQGWIERSNIRD